MLWSLTDKRRLVSVIALLSAFTLSDARAQTLEEALTAAYLSNPTLEAQRAAVRATDELVPQALGGWRPTVTLQSSIQTSDIDSSAAGRFADWHIQRARSGTEPISRRRDRGEHRPRRAPGPSGTRTPGGDRTGRAVQCRRSLYRPLDRSRGARTREAKRGTFGATTGGRS